MLLSLMKKDFLLVKKYLIVMFAAAVALPVFIKIKTEVMMTGGFFAFFISTLYILFILFNSVSMLEFKYKASALLCATPYTRNALVVSKYLFLLVLFIGTFILYTATALLIPSRMDMLSLSDFGTSFFIVTIIFSILIPVQYYFGFDKARYVFFFSIFLVPFVSPVIIKYIQANDFGFQLTLPVPSVVQDLLPLVLALAIGAVSLIASIRIYEKKNL